MLHTNNQIIKHKVGLLNLAEELQNVSRACKVMGVSRDTFYRYQELVKSGDIDARINKSRRVPNLKNRVDEAHALEDYKTREDLQRYKLNYNFGLQVSLLHHSCYE